jgi:drug/metabolite transporter (DMT)-like permease
LAGWAFLSEQLTLTQLIGCAVMLVGILLAQLRPPRAMAGCDRVTSLQPREAG